MLNENLVRAEKFLICRCSMKTVSCKKIVEEIFAHVQEHLPDTLREEHAPADLCIGLFCATLLIELLPTAALCVIIFVSMVMIVYIRPEMESICCNTMK